ncbi:MAG: PilZ domain-containing protein [Thermodesulfobacteriota bacterium]|nr:PilZ domain-containing protein [Thermodesulfobacteriota bacterium]
MMNDPVTKASSIALKSSTVYNNAATDTPTTSESTPDATKRSSMPMNTRRAHARAYREEPVQYAIYNAKKFHDATMYNESTGGMYFETEMRIAPGTDICIKIPHPEATGWTNNSCTARVRWCRQLNHKAGQCFGIGVQYHNNITQ